MKDTLLARRGIWLGISVLAVVAYLPAMNAPFVYDDKVEVVGNATIRVLDQWRAIGTYNPSRLLLILSYALNYHYAALQPLLYHGVNLAVHLLAVGAGLSLAEAVGRLGSHPRPLGAAAVAVGLWALHPMGTQAVTYITGRSESLCALFCLTGLSLWAQALQSERETGRPDRGTRALAWVAGLAALFSKEVGAVFPLAALALELMFPGRGPAVSGRASLSQRVAAVRWGWALPLLLLIAAGAALRLKIAGSLLPHEVNRPLLVQLLTQAEVWGRYVGLWLLPVKQTIFHVVPDVDPHSARAAVAGLGWVLGVGVAVLLGMRVPLVGFALLCGGLFLMPSSSFAPLKESMAEHRAYLLGFWLALAAVWGVSAPRRQGARNATFPWEPQAAAFGVALLGVVTGLTYARNTVWASEISLWSEAARRAPGSAEAWYGLGDARRFGRDFQGASEAYERATTLAPTNLDAWNNLGITRAELGDTEGAADAWRSALRQSPTYCKAHNNLGFLALRQQRWDEGILELSTTLAWCPNDVLAHWGLGNVYYGPRRSVSEARDHYQKVLELDPDFQKGEEIRKRLLELTW